MPDLPAVDVETPAHDPDRVLEVTDPRRLRALAHPLRLQLLRLIRQHQPVTGARLAVLTGDSTASVSYHLSVLHNHGFIEPDPAPGATRRHKPWRTTYESLRVISQHSDQPPAETVEGAVLGPLLAQARREQDDYLRGSSQLAGGWGDVGTFAMTDLLLTESEFDQLSADMEDVVTRYSDRGDRPDATQARFSVSFIAIPIESTGERSQG